MYNRRMELPSERQMRWILSSAARLLEAGAEPVRGLVQPTGEFFPDTFDGSAAGVAALMDRVLFHAGLSDAKVELAIVTPEGEEAAKVSCASGACGGSGKIEARSDRVARRGGGGYTVTIGAGELGHAVVLTTAMVRATSFIFLSEADAIDGFPAEEVEPAIDLAAVMLGFGVLVANGSHITMKGCSSVAVHSATKLHVAEVALALAIYCRLHGVNDRVAARHLDVTARDAFDEAAAWASSNDRVVRLLRSNPDAIRAGDFKLSPARSWLARALGIGKKRQVTSDDAMAELEAALREGGVKPKPAMDEANKQLLKELRALVDESLDG